jgi:hypothetical protein
MFKTVGGQNDDDARGEARGGGGVELDHGFNGLQLIGRWGADGLTLGATFCFFGLEGAQAALSFENLSIGRSANCPSIAMEADLGHLSLKLGKSKIKFGDDCFVVQKALSSLAI